MYFFPKSTKSKSCVKIEISPTKKFRGQLFKTLYGDPVEMVKWVLSIKIPPLIFFNRIPAASPKYFECKFDNKNVQIENLSSSKFKVKVQSSAAQGCSTSFQVGFESIYRGPGKPCLIEIKIKGIKTQKIWPSK